MARQKRASGTEPIGKKSERRGKQEVDQWRSDIEKRNNTRIESHRLLEREIEKRIADRGRRQCSRRNQERPELRALHDLFRNTCANCGLKSVPSVRNLDQQKQQSKPDDRDPETGDKHEVELTGQ